jgi:hypothetical protein
MNFIHFQCVYAKNAKRIGDIRMSINNFDQRCQHYNLVITYDPPKKEENEKYIPLNSNGKRHFCSSANKIVHEYRTVECVKKIIDDTSRRDLLCFELELRIADRVEK